MGIYLHKIAVIKRQKILLDKYLSKHYVLYFKMKSLKLNSFEHTFVLNRLQNFDLIQSHLYLDKYQHMFS